MLIGQRLMSRASPRTSHISSRVIDSHQCPRRRYR